MSRAQEIGAALAQVRGRIGTACAAAGRPPDAVRLLAVTKTFPAADVVHLVDLGCAGFGEATEQEAAAKVAEVAQRRPGVPVSWTVLGRLQRNKSRSVARWAAEVQSVDSERLARALDRAVGNALAAGERPDRLDVLVQLSLDGDPGRGGVAAAGVDALADAVAGAQHLRLRGLMVVLPQDAKPDPGFAAARDVAERLRRAHPGAVELSAGMSGDLEAAIRYGSTCVRVGTALLGSRPLPSAQTTSCGLPPSPVTPARKVVR